MPNTFVISSSYRGPYYLHEDITTSLETLALRLSIELTECESHSLLVVQNFDSEEVLEATAIYLVSAIAQIIEANLQIRKALFGEAEMSRELERDVINVIGEHNVDDEFKKMVRDPWIWESISHMLIHLSRFDPDFHPSGRVLVKTSIKYDVHDHGLDVIAIYEASNLGISAGECKAYFDDPSRGITDASNKLGEIDAGVRDIEIRSVVNQLRSALDEDAKEKLSGAFWRDERSYLPFVCCDSEHACSWTQKRQSLNRLAIPVSRKFLFPLSLPEARKMFDAISYIMRSYVSIKE
ncbi:MAG: hypothetical protein ABSA71_18425 [Desulfomonilia bacterium]|jgi:hypothetical protein